jgi:excisionase family DNA binding protein
VEKHTSDVGITHAEGQDRSGDAESHLARIREAVIAYGAAEDLVVGDILLPAMSPNTMRSPGGRAMVSLLKALDRPETPARATGTSTEVGRSDKSDPPDTDTLDRFSGMPFLVCTLEHPGTGLRVAMLAAAISTGKARRGSAGKLLSVHHRNRSAQGTRLGTPELLTTSEVAQIFRVDPKTVTRWADDGRIGCTRTLGGHRRFRRDEAEALLVGTPESNAETSNSD